MEGGTFVRNVLLQLGDRVYNSENDRWGTVLRVLGENVEVQTDFQYDPDGDNGVQQWPIASIGTVTR